MYPLTGPMLLKLAACAVIAGAGLEAILRAATRVVTTVDGGSIDGVGGIATTGGANVAAACARAIGVNLLEFIAGPRPRGLPAALKTD
jgi:hypothetical protein